MQVQNGDVAEEIVQEAFARAWASPSTPSDATEFRRWLYRIITNLARDHFRARRPLAIVPVPAQRGSDPGEELERGSIDEPLAAALRGLTVAERQVIYLRYFEDRSFAETARMLGRPQVSLRVVVHRALAKLRRQLELASWNSRVAI
jgi:RNA polymerase sigma-70 factor (ECF subfamily)